MPPAITYRTTDEDKWGAGKGANLTPAEVDTNFWELVQALQNVTEKEPFQISNITVSDGALTVHLDNGSTYGPFELPVAELEFRGEWEEGHTYHRNDLFTAGAGPDRGLYLVRITHETPTDGEFNPNDGNMMGPYAVLLFPYPNLYDIGFFFPGAPGFGIEDGEAMFCLVARQPFWIPSEFAGSVASFGTDPDDEAVFEIYKNEELIGTFTAGGSGGSGFAMETESPVQFMPGDRLRVLKPVPYNTAARDFAMNIAAYRGTV